MGRRLTPISELPPAQWSNPKAKRGIIVGREVLPGQLDPLFDTVVQAGLAEEGVVLRRPDPDNKRTLRVEILRADTLRRSNIASRLGETTLHSVIAKANEQHEQDGSPLFIGRKLMFRLSNVKSNDHSGICFVNIETVPESTSEMQEDGEAVKKAIMAASGASFGLDLNYFGMTVAAVNLGPDSRDQSMVMAHRICTAIQEPLEGLEMQFDRAGYDKPPPIYKP